MQMEAKQQTNRKWLNRDVLKREAKRGRDNVKNDKKVHVNKKSRNIVPAFILWRRQDSNLRPSGYEPVHNNMIISILYIVKSNILTLDLNKETYLETYSLIVEQR